MSDKRSSEDRVEKRRLLVKDSKIELNFLKTIGRLGMIDHRTSGNRIIVREAMLQVMIDHDFSGEEWDDNYNPKNG